MCFYWVGLFSFVYIKNKYSTLTIKINDYLFIFSYNMSDLSSELNHYIRVKIGESKSKEEEDSYVKKDIEKLKKDILKIGHSEKELWEIILRIVYADMLGHHTDFAHSFIVNCI